MNEDTLNMEVRKFPQKVGATSQREIENAVREAVRGGRLARNEKLKPRVTLEVKSSRWSDPLSCSAFPVHGCRGKKLFVRESTVPSGRRTVRVGESTASASTDMGGGVEARSDVTLGSCPHNQ